ncbi:MAG TPA: TetR/AcrR family transcriptional regulator [Acidimicrobiales bacterium]|nr:TetR/AcrR family transcriptional regulator [Acidimicrobiales bacterium]
MPDPTEHSSETEDTRRRILDATIAIIDESGERAVRVADVARAAGIVTSAIYHHFRDRNALVNAARADQYRGRLLSDALALDDLLALDDEAEQAAALGALMVRPDDPERQRHRWDRIAALAAAQHHPDLRAEITELQRAVTDRFAAVIDQAKERGWVDPHVDSRAAALLMQAVSLGLVIADIDDRPLDADSWGDLLTRWALAVAPGLPQPH